MEKEWDLALTLRAEIEVGSANECRRQITFLEGLTCQMKANERRRTACLDRHTALHSLFQHKIKVTKGLGKHQSLPRSLEIVLIRDSIGQNKIRCTRQCVKVLLLRVLELEVVPVVTKAANVDADILATPACLSCVFKALS